MTDHLLSVAFQTDKPVAAYGALAKAVEEYGFDTVSVYNDLFYQPAWPALFEMAWHTRRIRLGPAAVNPFLTHPISIAGQIALLDELSEGRAYLGLARGAWLDHLDITPARPVTALKEAFACIRHLLTQAEEPFKGRVFSLAGGEVLRWTIRRADVPFLLGSWGKMAIRTCIDVVSEVKVGGTANPAVVPFLLNVISEAAETKGGSRMPTKLVVGAVTVVDQDGPAARDLARREVALYLPVVARLDPTLSLEPDWLDRIQAAADSHDFDQAAALISDGMLSKFAFAGTPEEVIHQAVGLFAAGTGRIEFGTPHGLTTAGGLNLLGTQVFPALKAMLS
jgi:5,10-methylenetetrahydromethanopterin reductase